MQEVTPNTDHPAPPEQNEKAEYEAKLAQAIAIMQEQLEGRYRILRPLGSGSQGAVFLAESSDTNKKVAIKRLSIGSVKDWKLYDLFQREAATLKRLDMPGIAKLIEVREYLNTATPCAYIVQDFIDADPLQKFIERGHRFQITQIGSLLLKLLDIIEALHHCDPPVIHRDIKPSNILLNYTNDSNDLEVHLIDFGAVANPQVKSGGSTVVGTYGYMAPEQLMGHSSEASDLYSLAIVAVYLLSGTPPENLEIQDLQLLIDPHLEHLPHEITSLLRMMLATNIDSRLTDYDVIRQFFTALKDQRFENIPCPQISTIRTARQSLKDIHAYLQAGNIELWQSLSDHTPRKLPFRLKLDLLYKAITTKPEPGYEELFPTNYYSKWKHFLTHARKTMATVIRIEYQSSFIFHEPDFTAKTARPTWNIIYSFNPPDDSSPDPLLHSVITHAWSKDLKEGSLIPILYLIDHDENGEIVRSSPFPIPAVDTFQIGENTP